MRTIARSLTTASALALLAVGVAMPASAQGGCTPSSGPDAMAVAGGDMALAGVQPGPAPEGSPVHCATGAQGTSFGPRAVVAAGNVFTLTGGGTAEIFPVDGSAPSSVTISGVTDVLPGGQTTDGERVYIGTPDSVLALAAADGGEVWRVAVATGNVSTGSGAGRPAVVDGRVFVAITAGDGRSIERALVALDAADGSELWRQPLFEQFPPGPIAADAERVVLWDGSGTIRAYDPASGEVAWETGIEALGITPMGPVATGGGFVAAILTGGEVIVLSAADGSEVWRMTPDPALPASVAIHEGTLLVNDVLKLIALDLATGAEQWSADVQSGASPFPDQPVPAVVDGIVVQGTSDASTQAALVAWDLASGQELWRAPTTIFGAILSPVVSGGRVYATTVDVNGGMGLFAFGAGEPVLS